MARPEKKDPVAASTVIRYVLLQLPALALVTVLAFGIGMAADLAWYWKWIAVGLWALKDIILFPLTWRSYSTRPGDTVHSMIGKRGTALGPLSPRGRVLVESEQWNALLIDDGVTVGKGMEIIVVDMKGMTLIVKPRKEVNHEN